ncbi:MAG: DUF6631 family protein [Pseudoxanthomonas sp.]
MTDELDVLEPQGTEVTYRGERLVIQPLAVGMLPKFVRLARPVIDVLMDAKLDEAAVGADVDVLMDLIGEHGDKCFDAAALVTGRPREWIEGGPIDEFFALAQAVIQVNRDFFTRKLAPLLAARAKPSDGTGQTVCSSSSTTATH